MARSLNVADSAAVATVVDEVVALFGRVDVSVNNAGTGAVDAFAEITDENWARVIGVNLTGAFHCARAAVRAMQKTGTPGSCQYFQHCCRCLAKGRHTIARPRRR